jgi:FMN phosphatase YigB (HAD superfamily)
MIKAVVTDFSKVLLFPQDANYQGGLNALNNKLLADDPSYPFFDHFALNNELLEYYRRLNTNVPVFVFTTETIQDHPAIKEQVQHAFSGVLSAKKLGLSKTEVATYVTIASMVHCRPGEVIFIDDKPSNVESAAGAGLETILFTSNSDAIAKVKALITVRL